MNRLEGKYVLITGASQGLGRQLALDYAREGAAGIAIVARGEAALKKVSDRITSNTAQNNVVLAVAADLSRPGEVERVMEQVRSQLTAKQSQTKILTITADLSKPKDIERVVATTLNEFNGRLDVLVNNASTIGATPMPYLLDYPLEDFCQVIDTNLIAPFLLIKKVLPAMSNHGGSIINVTSDAGINGYPGWGAYGISKFGIEGMSQTWAAELAGSGVRLNWVDPGDMNTAMHRAAEPNEDPNQWANPADVTDIFIYLASDESKHTHGQRFEAQSEVEVNSNDLAISSVG
ncbi:SDR family NAD(P)-dependent oxidoreductase [Pleurocapsa sp. PCC 7319]|uniref:SDR family NAD(P)-dependent oxidoreductase n=1 Tax=Pleurocapsa sp. PCC 7319 TaxID=118161 RepID=UPI0003487A9F|nr:SDR family oxidoreductase [Pleurocapsa sp. PCC 7319]